MSRNEQILADVKGGMTYTQAAQKNGVTKNVVAGLCNRSGVKVGLRESSVEGMRAGGFAMAKLAHADPKKHAKLVKAMHAGAAKWRAENRKAVLESIARARAARFST